MGVGAGSIVKQLFAAALIMFAGASFVNAQRATVTVSLDEAFFDALLDSVFKNFEPPEFAIAENAGGRPAAPALKGAMALTGQSAPCAQTVKILREMSGVRTAVRFRDGKIYVPLAFSGNYSPPFVGCVEFGGWAEANIHLEFDQQRQRLIGRATVFNVNLNGSGGIGGSLIARMLQTSIDRKMNPIEILNLEKLSFGVPVQNSGNLRMRAVAARPVAGNGVLNIQIDYLFQKG